ncbi:TPA: hypothetical protein J5F84_004886 [Escherichia coli]|nr:hypothetical protein [Escherichia coli]
MIDSDAILHLYRSEEPTERLALLVCLPVVILLLNMVSGGVTVVTGLVLLAGTSLRRFWPADLCPAPCCAGCSVTVTGVILLTVTS